MVDVEKVSHEKADSDISSRQLHVQQFPEELRVKLKIRALETGVTFRELLIHVLAEWCETDRDGWV